MIWSGGAALSNELSAWNGVTVRPHRFGGVEFQLEGKEIGHLHGDRLFDLLCSRSDRDRWINSGKARPHHLYPESGWVSVYLHTEEEVAHAIEIARFKYDQILSRRDEL